MDKSALVSIIVVNYNGAKYLGRCFESLYAGTYKNIEIIFVDNGSKDGSVSFVRQNFPDIPVVDNKENLGLAVASNRGAQAARGEYLFFYNNDTIAGPQLIELLVKKMESDPAVGIAGCRTYTYDGSRVINEGVACDIFGYPYAPGGHVFYVDAAIFIRRSLFDKLEGFDEKMFLYGEDRDICWRTWLYGYTVEVVPGAAFYHDSACITGNLKDYTTSVSKRFWGEFNALRSLCKNYGALSLFFILPAFMLINLAEILVFLFRGNFTAVRQAYLKSYLENIKDLKGLLRKRAKVQRERLAGDQVVLSRMSKVSGKLRLLLAMGLPGFSGKTKYASVKR